MKSFASVVALVAVVAAQDLPAPAGDFTLGAWSPQSGFTGTTINANGGAFFIVRTKPIYHIQLQMLTIPRERKLAPAALQSKDSTAPPSQEPLRSSPVETVLFSWM